MNERIKELAEQAGMLAFHPVMDVDDEVAELLISWQGWSTDLEKFAELIVAECVQIADLESKSQRSIHGKQAADSIWNSIRNRFGEKQ